MRCYILSTLLYASETWVSNIETEGSITSLEMWIHRRMLRISYKQHISNEDILVGLNVKPEFMEMTQKENADILATLLEERDITTNNYC